MDESPDNKILEIAKEETMKKIQQEIFELEQVLQKDRQAFNDFLSRESKNLENYEPGAMADSPMTLSSEVENQKNFLIREIEDAQAQLDARRRMLENLKNPQIHEGPIQ